jgi:hypothetical protein
MTARINPRHARFNRHLDGCTLRPVPATPGTPAPRHLRLVASPPVVELVDECPEVSPSLEESKAAHPAGRGGTHDDGPEAV